MELGIETIVSHSLKSFNENIAVLNCEYSGAEIARAATTVVMVTPRRPKDDLYQEIMTLVEGDASKLPINLKRIGDCKAPAIIAAATYAGHR